ncbi:MAG: TlpA family protein disulfide reductase [Marmoricola sp.]|nr:TlpA family protein disulfide reductase [Marmoricola sp.]
MRLLLHAGDTATEVSVHVDGDDLVLDRDAVLAATGWKAEDHGLCRGDVCRPARLGERVGLARLAELLGRPLALERDDTLSVAVLGEPGGTMARRGDLSPALRLHDADGEEVEVTRRGRRTLVVAWSTWCGCRYELPAWAALAEELAPLGLDLVTVALDDDTERVRHFTEKAGLPAVLDPDHRLSDVFGVVNVPSTIWLDADGRVVKPPTIAPGDDQFQEFTEVEAARHHEALRAWLEGQEPGDVEQPEADDDVRAARAERRLAAWLHAHDRPEAARRHYDAAVALAPLDFSIRRSSMRHRGENPFGEEFLELWQEWSDAGRPGYAST